MTKQEKADWLTGNDLDDAGYQPKPESAIRLHNSKETTKHLVMKSLVVMMLQRKGRRWDTEVKCPNGRVDVLDFGPPDGGALVYEIETSPTPSVGKEKAEKYAIGPVRDVIVLDAAEAPNELPQLAAWIEQRVV